MELVINSLIRLKDFSSEQPFRTKFLVVLLITFSLQVITIKVFPLDFDEGVHILIARLIEKGYEPYTEVFISRLPLFVLIMQGIWKIGFGKIFLSKIIFIGLNSLFLISIGYLGRSLLGEKEALLGGILTAFAPMYLSASVALMADLLSVSLATFSVLLVVIYLQRGNRKWVFLAGAFYGASLWVKLLVIYIGPILLLLLLARQITIFQWDSITVRLQPSWRNLIADVLLLSVGGMIITLPTLLVFDLQAVYESTFALRLALREALSFDLDVNLMELSHFLQNNIFFLVGVLASLIFAYRKSERAIWFLLLWGLIALVWLMVQIPLREQHLAVLWGPMGLMAAWGFLQMGEWLIEFTNPNRVRFGTWAMVFLGLFLGGYGAFDVYQVPGLLNRARNIYYEKQVRQWHIRPALVDFFQRVTTADDCIISDDPVFTVETRRLPPPALSEPSKARLYTGYLNLDSIKTAAADYNCQAVISINDKFSSRSIPGLWLWAEDFFDYHLEIEDITIYYNEPYQSMSQLDGNFSNLIQLMGYSLNTEAIAPDGTVRLNLYWQPIGSLTGQEKVFVQLRNGRGATIARADHIILEHQVSSHAGRKLQQTDDWVREATPLQIPLPLPVNEGPYRIYVGLYDPLTLERFSLANDASGENAIVIDLPPLPPAFNQ